MSNIIIWLFVCLASITWGGLHYKAGYNQDLKNQNSYFKFLEFWRPCLNYFIALIIAYYFVSVRWAYIVQGMNLSVGDFILGIVFIIGVFGWLPYLTKYSVEGVTGIFGKILNK
jgi:hypothetical protein